VLRNHTAVRKDGDDKELKLRNRNILEEEIKSMMDTAKDSQAVFEEINDAFSGN
jgi:hypothetical protein